ncbi:GAF domain-containing protein [Burkholderia sp. FERM BP-3421]|uniref:PelD GGDEF domain-containing protein n=1 Tax=Burkholderia sp. FERM BP-3421 TaxID=1494466 RepID=UPI00235F3699|nr:PelD GGDEF domain-containing protein [Burkholderia sp. FERM BP-3421]WDD93935.1 GAF domain-containing protein [Burkholderia sp. FERM BP-3421]
MAESISTELGAPHARGGIAGWFAPVRRGSAVMLETLFATLALVMVGHLRSPGDPLQAHADFPWLWFAPAVFALRRGTLAGVGSAGLMVLAALCFGDGRVAAAFPSAAFFLVSCALTLVAGQFGDLWASRARQARAARVDRAERQSVRTKHAFLLRLSHERLEQDGVARPATLREAFTRLRALALDDAPAAASAPLPGAARFLDTVAQACRLERAALYAWRDGVLGRTPMAAIGESFEFDPAAPLAHEALESGKLARSQPGARSRHFACAPLIDATGAPVGVLVIEHMPFLAQTRDNLQFLLTMCGYYADGLRHAPLTRALRDACPYDFALDYARLTRLHDTTGIESSLVALVFERSRVGRMCREHVLRMRRSLDAQWLRPGGAGDMVLTLMPLTGGGTMDGYLIRMEESLRVQLGVSYADARIRVATTRVGGGEPVEMLRAFLAQCDELSVAPSRALS